MGLLSFFQRGDLSSAFNTKAFDQNLERTLANNGVPHARQVGGTFTLDDEARGAFKAIMPDFPAFATATVLVTDRPDEKASAYMVGQLTDGTQAIISIQNLARLKDIEAMTDKFSARRSAHAMRERLGTLGELQAKERNQLYTAKP